MGDSSFQKPSTAEPPRFEVDLNDVNMRLGVVVGRLQDIVARTDGAQPIKGETGTQQIGNPSHTNRLASLSDKVNELDNLTKQLATLI